MELLYTTANLDRLRPLSSCAISDALDMITRKQLVLPAPIRLLAGARIFGPAITLLMATTGEKAHHNVAMQILDECEEGTVLVLAGEPDPVGCAFGAAEIAVATVRRLGGLLTDCPVRYRLPLPDHVVGVAGSGLSPASGFGRFKTMALCKSSICAGITIEQGDLVVGDAFGVVIVPAKLVKTVAEVAPRYEQRIDSVAHDAAKSGSVRDAVKRHWSI